MAIVGFFVLIWLLTAHTDLFVGIVVGLLVYGAICIGSIELADYFPPWNIGLAITMMVALIAFWIAVAFNQEYVRAANVPFFILLFVAALLLPFPILGIIHKELHIVIIAGLPFWGFIGILGAGGIRDKIHQNAGNWRRS